MNNARDKIKKKNRYWSFIERKIQKQIRITPAQIILHTGSYVVGKCCLEDTLRRFKIKEGEMNVKISSCDAMYMKNAQRQMPYLPKIEIPRI